MNTKICRFLLFGIALLMSSIYVSPVYAELSYNQKVKFVGAIEETQGHILAAKENIKNGTPELVQLHATHPINELYEDLHQGLKYHPNTNEKVELVLFILKNTNPNIDEENFDKETSIIVNILDEAKSVLISKEIQNDPIFKFHIVVDLVKSAHQEYITGINSGERSFGIVELQDSHGFVKRAQVIMSGIEGLSDESKKECEDALEELEKSILDRSSTEDVTTKVNKIVEGMAAVKEKELGYVIPDDFEQNIISKNTVIPTWIKLNAGWWESSLISDKEFLTGIQYLIKNDVLKIPPTQMTYSPSVDQSIPEWIKIRSGWWASNQLSNEDFISGIQYLIEHKILVVENS